MTSDDHKPGSGIEELQFASYKIHLEFSLNFEKTGRKSQNNYCLISLFSNININDSTKRCHYVFILNLNRIYELCTTWD